MDIFEHIVALQNEINETTFSTADDAEKFRIRFLGTKNILKDIFSEIKNVPNERKKEFGQVVNVVKQAAEEKHALAKEKFEANNSSANKDIDLTLPGDVVTIGARHPIQLVKNQIVDIFKRLGFAVQEDREIEDDWHNFTALNMPEDHPARDMQDTFFVNINPDIVLRTHTSSVQVRTMENQKPPIRILSPGRVFRNETISARAHCFFHQVEGLYIDENVSFADLLQTLDFFVKEMFGQDVKIKLRPSYFPFTEPSAEMDIWLGTDTEKNYRLTKGTGWLEILGCGMVDPQVLENCGIDARKYSGFAFGMGIERQALRLYEIGDIRLLFENDVRFLRQFSSAM